MIPPFELTTAGSVSVLNREPMGMKPRSWCWPSCAARVSVLNREPMGMKQICSVAG